MSRRGGLYSMALAANREAVEADARRKAEQRERMIEERCRQWAVFARRLLGRAGNQTIDEAFEPVLDDPAVALRATIDGLVFEMVPPNQHHSGFDFFLMLPCGRCSQADTVRNRYPIGMLRDVGAALENPSPSHEGICPTCRAREATVPDEADAS